MKKWMMKAKMNLKNDCIELLYFFIPLKELDKMLKKIKEKMVC